MQSLLKTLHSFLFIVFCDNCYTFSKLSTKYCCGQKPFAGQRYYSIDRVFRNEAVDRTHLAEFHQIEGILLTSYPLFKLILQQPS